MPPSIFELATKITNPIAATVFVCCLLCLILLALLRRKLSKRQRAVGYVVVCLVFFLGMLPIISKDYLAGRGPYQVRVTVVSPDGELVRDAVVTCVPSGERKVTSEGTECDLSPAIVPEGGLLKVFASTPEGMVGSGQLILDDDKHPVLSVHVVSNQASTIRGEVIDEDRNGIAGAVVTIVGLDVESVTTGPLGGFQLPLELTAF